MLRYRVELRVRKVDASLNTRWRWEFVRPSRGEPYELATLDAAHEFVRTWYRNADTRIVAVRYRAVDGKDSFARVFCTAGDGCCTHIVNLSRRELAGFYWYWTPSKGFWMIGGKRKVSVKGKVEALEALTNRNDTPVGVTKAELLKAARFLMPDGYTVNPSTVRGEFVVREKACGNRSKHGYFTESLSDAVNSAWAMSARGVSCCKES